MRIVCPFGGVIARSLCGSVTSSLLRRHQHSAARQMFSIHQLDNQDWSTLVSRACNILHDGGIIAVPTDTIYGVAGLTQNSAAIGRLYEVKGRNCAKPVAISVAGIEEVYLWGRVTVSAALLHDLLPGPVTVVFERTPALNPSLNPGSSTIGVRVPASGFVCDVARQCGQPLALTSANVSAQPSALSIQEFLSLWPKLDAVFDAGPLSTSTLNKSGSTVVDLSKTGLFTVIRDGCAIDATRNTLLRHGLREDHKS